MKPGLRTLGLAGLVLLAPACSLAPRADPPGRIVLVDGRGVPVQGAAVYPEEGDAHSGNREAGWNRDDSDDRYSDAQGVVHAALEQYLWDSDGCYHFVVRRAGYEDFTMTVSAELFPRVLTINLGNAIQKGSPQGTAPPAASK